MANTFHFASSFSLFMTHQRQQRGNNQTKDTQSFFGKGIEIKTGYTAILPVTEPNYGLTRFDPTETTAAPNYG